MNPSMRGKVVVVTGANQGIGKETAAACAAGGAKVVLFCRNEEKGNAAVEELRGRGGDASLVVADFASFASIRAATDTFKRTHDRLDVLVNNAGVFVPHRRVTVDGFEETFAVNHLGYFLTTACLREILVASGASRVVNVASRAHRGGRMNWDDLQSERRYRAFPAYAASKLANVLFTYELARRLEGTRVTANCLHPGVVASGFAQTYGGLAAVLWRMCGVFMKSNAEGAATSIHLATSPDVEGETGKYFAESKEARSTRASHDRDAARRLWEISETMVAPKN